MVIGSPRKDFYWPLIGFLAIYLPMICVIDIIEGPAQGKRIWLKENQCLEVGRISSADFSIPTDSHLSRRHLLLDSTQNGFRVRDVGSANGTFLNDQRVTVHALNSGDTIRAGMSSFRISLRENDVNPHQQDGISFNNQAELRQTECPTDSATATQEEQDQLPTSIRTFQFSDRVDYESEFQIQEMSEPQTLSANDITVNDLVANVVDIEPSPLDQLYERKRNDAEVARETWWKSFFTTSHKPYLFEQSKEFLAIQGDFIGLAQKFSATYELSLIINQNQLQSDSLELIERLRHTGAIESLSKTLCFIPGKKVRDLWGLIYLCLRQDAIICIGSRRQVSVSELLPFANSLSYPSMFETHLRDLASEIGRWFVSNDSFAMYELDRDGKIGLLIQSKD